jgi:hypothetical protein
LGVRLVVGLALVVFGSIVMAHRRARHSGLPDDDHFDRE